MEEVDLNAEVIHRLSRGQSPDEIVLHLCQTTGWSWNKAKRFVHRIQAESQPMIAKKQLPLTFGVALILFTAGLAVAGYGLYGLYVLLFTPQGGMPEDLTSYFMPVIEAGQDPLEAMFPAIPAYFRFIVYFLFGPIPAILLGLSMILGSLVGMKRAWSDILSGDWG